MTSVGQTQYSANGTSGWSNTIGAVLTAGEAVDFYIRTDPAAVVEADDGSYIYKFAMETEGAGGLSLVNDAVNRAHITGTTPADQVGKTFSVNCTIEDSYGTSVAGTSLSKVWTA